MNYINELKRKYEKVFRKMSIKMKSGDSGKIVKEASEIARSMGMKSNNAEIRDALIAFAASGELEIEKHVPRRLEIKFKKSGK